MLKTFVIVAYLTAPGYAPESFVLDSGLSGSDCIAAIEAFDVTDSIEVMPGHIMPASDFTFACEVEQ